MMSEAGKSIIEGAMKVAESCSRQGEGCVVHVSSHIDVSVIRSSINMTQKQVVAQFDTQSSNVE